MADLIGTSLNRVVVGLGKTGMSCVRYLARKKLPFKVMDTRSNPPGIDELKRDYPDIAVHLGSFNQEWLNRADELVISPGIALAEPAIAEAMVLGAIAIGDIELFCREVNVPVVAITGSNGKSTVTALLGEMAAKAGVRASVGGNIGTPALDLLEDEEKALYILELSSFQLETTHSLQAAAATILNMSPDHMDRYQSMVDYHGAKQRIYRGCRHAVYNKQDALTTPLLPQATQATAFTSGKPDLHDYGLIKEGADIWLCKGVEKLLNTSSIKLCGQHNQMNALAALALGEAVGIPLKPMLETLEEFPGLAHRCQWVASINGVTWINDSKATNVGAAVAAIEGVGELQAGKLVLIAGGDGKGADFSEMTEPARRYVREVVLIGQNGPDIGKALDDEVSHRYCDDLTEAVNDACQIAEEGDAVLLAPACASFDMFDSFEHRGDSFIYLVKALEAKESE
ncbi:MAG: UDP-N-acetylmuramoyl-L-alanine--D-glutamate ligase [Endozoicomonas sp.]